MANSRYREDENRYADENHYRDRGGYYDSNNDRDHARAYRDDWQRISPEFRSGIGLGAALVAAMAFGLGWLIGARWHPESYGRIGGMPRRDLSPPPTRDSHHTHVSMSDPNAPAGSPPDAGELIGQQQSGKSAKESAQALRQPHERSIRSREATASASSKTDSTSGDGGKGVRS